MHTWVLVSAVGGAFLTAVAVLAVLWKAVRIAAKVVELHPVVMHIAEEFKANGSSTLKDAMNRLEKAAETAQASADKAQKVADEARAAINLQTALLERVLNPRDHQVD